jgi:glucose/arabinose dehydrogenase
MPVRASTVVAVALLASLIALCLYVKPAETVPGGFSDTRVTDSFLPTALDFTPDGRMLVTSKTGQLYVYDQAGNKLANPALDLGPETCGNSERGLLGVAVDPRFGAGRNDFVYLYYTHKTSDACPTKDPDSSKNPVNRVSRFSMDGVTVNEASEEVLIDNIPSPNGNHNGGDLQFGNDGNLYVSAGDGGCHYAEKTNCQYENAASRDKNMLLGKILRIAPDGSIPAGNPYTGPDSARCNVGGRTSPDKNCQETYASGFRNPFRFAIDPDVEDATKLFVNDVGGQRWEEIDRVKAGADYGWNVCEGRADNPYKAGTTNCDGAELTGPIQQYHHNSGCESITAGAFVPDDTNWPARYKDAYLFGDFVCGKMFSLTPKAGGGLEKQTFVRGLGLRSAVAMDFGPYRNGQALYYATFEDGGMIRRIAFTDGPSAEVEAVGNNYGDTDPNKAGLQMNFDASRTTDPTGTPLSYGWDFDGNGTLDKTTTGPETSHTYGARGRYTVTLKVTNGDGNVSDPAKIDVFPGDEPPAPTIDSLTEAQTQAAADGFRVGGDYTATGSATDPDGDAPVELEWEVVQRHDNNHEHPLEGATGEVVTFSGPKPEGLYSTNPDENYVEVRLTAADSLGLSKTVVRRLPPRRTDLTFKTEPGGLRVDVAGKSLTSPRTITSWEGYDLNVLAARQRKDGRTYALRAWSDGETATERVLETPGQPTEYTATFRRLRR